MVRKSLIRVFLCLAVPAISGFAQDAKTALAAVEKAMGSADVKSIQYSGTGYTAALGQAVNPATPWPKFDLRAYTRTIDYVDGSSKEELTRVQGSNPWRGGGGTPLMGEQKQNAEVSGSVAWNMAGNAVIPQFGATLDERRLQIWLTPDGFIRAAKRGNGCAIRFDCEAKVSKKMEGGKQVTVITAGVGKYPVWATLDEQNMITKIEAKFPNPVLGDMPIVTTFSDYKDYKGVKFPSRIVQTEGGHLTFELNVTDVKVNAPASLPIPDAAKAEAPHEAVYVQLLADGVWYLTGGTHHSLVVEFKDYVAIIEAPLSEQRSLAVMDEARRLVINKPIKYVINTHHHFDHSGGLRTYVAAGATVITSASNKLYYDQIFKEKATLEPDKLSKTPKIPAYILVADKYVLTDGVQKIELYAVKDDAHADGMLMAYIPNGKILVEADDWTPGAADAPPPANPSMASINLYENIQRLKLDVAKIAPIHGRLATMAEFLKFLGKPKT
jgi:glyoxylase-like metal-dependent hydrolase (beta-lactamase superfamily II)